ncbi:PC-esterase domain containing 1A L homeolog [Xenopus laevis]|uniref:PC-esterase domain containing 1A L homeolog n=2 Tax=Xenopus laevis TaxID=8355 RepID=A0A8J0PVB5_XENLA|nr:PC-esterase domain containing 1A L homeolog [Xenopus laevis]
MGYFSMEHAQQLLHNKYVAILGDSIQRSVYKDLVKFLQDGSYLTEIQLKCKGEKTFLKDTLVEGGVLDEMHNGVTYREVRQYSTDHHLVRFYFLTRIYSDYMESILSDFKADHKPDVLIINSCIWDVNRYNDIQLREYRSNLETLFSRLREVLNPECLIIWNMTMPVGFRDTEMPEYVKHNLRWDVIDGNFYSATFANLYNIDVIDMHYHFRLELPNRCRDAVHWNQLAHRKCTQILLSHIAKAWGVEVPQKPQGASISRAPSRVVTWRSGNADPFEKGRALGRGNCQREKLPLIGSYCPGYTSFDERSQDIRGEFSFLPGQPLKGHNGMPGFAPFHGNYPKAQELSFVTDTPFMLDNFTPGYISFDANGNNMEAAPPRGPYPFQGMNMMKNFAPHQPFPPMNFGYFPDYKQFNDHPILPMRRPIKQRDGRIHPYRIPAPLPSRIY